MPINSDEKVESVIICNHNNLLDVIICCLFSFWLLCYVFLESHRVTFKVNALSFSALFIVPGLSSD